MQIKFASRHGYQQIEARDLLSDGYRVWHADEIKDVPDDQVISVRLPNDRVVTMHAVEAIFNMGPNFVDAATGLNPKYACSRCGEEALSETWTNHRTLQNIPFADAEGKRLCLPDYIADHPELDAGFRFGSTSDEVMDEAHKRREAAKANADPNAPALEGAA